MLKRLLIAGAAFCALATAAHAQTYPQVKGPGGSFIGPIPSTIVGLDSVTGRACVIASTSTCQLPTSGSGGGGGGGAVTGALNAFADGWNITLGKTTDNAQTDYTQAASEMALLKGILQAVQAQAVLAGSNLAAQVGSVGSAPNNVNGASSYATLGGTGNALLTATPVQIGATGAHSLYYWQCKNPNPSEVWIQVFDLASGSVTLGTTTPKMAWPIPAAGYWEDPFPGEMRPAFATAITVAAATTATGATAPATGLSCNFLYK